MSEKKKSSFLAVFAMLLVLSVVLGGTLAYLTKNLGSRANNFTLSSIDIELIEEKWDNLDSDDRVVYPGRSIVKDPKVKNTGDNNLYVYIEVKVPLENIRTVSDGEVKCREILEFNVNKDDWTLIKSTTSENYQVKVYAYTKEILAPGDETSTLFESDKVTFVNMIEGESKKGYEFEMPINAYAIQSDYLAVEGESMQEIMKNAFEKYKTAEENQ